MEESMSNGTQVVKRSGETEPLNLNKLHIMVEEACKDLAGVSASQVEMQSGIQFYDGITTAEVQEILIRSASIRCCSFTSVFAEKTVIWSYA
jgi:ribonucleoside-diphosphate reductase alpha chain